MLPPELLADLEQLLGGAPAGAQPVGGGSISPAWRVGSGDGTLFVKTGPARRAAMFAAEAGGLEALRATETVRVPAVRGRGVAGATAWLALEWLELSRSGAADARLGERLAALHRCSACDFGWNADNFIGATPQPNERAADWTVFLRERRLGYQLRLAAANGCSRRLVERGEKLLDRLPAFFAGYRPVPSLLHGDLWGGNHAVLPDGEPVLFDPAVHYGDREAEIAMTELFGGFGRSFYAAYAAVWPLDPGYPQRRPIYQLYHVLNHFNLFGGGYARQAEALADAALSGVV